MKKVIKILTLLIVALVTNCQKDNIPTEIFVEIETGSKKPTAIVDCKDILFKYFLSDEDEEISTRFNREENFYFNFSIRNHREDTLYIVNNFLYNESFCEVSSEDTSGLKPFTYIVRQKISSFAHPLLPGEEYYIEVPWSDSRDDWWVSLHCFFESNHCDPLPKGKYHTTFTHTFCFDRPPYPSESICTVEITFKINFEII